MALSYEVLWTRELLNVLGSTTRASAATLAAFMAGIAIGAWVAGRWSGRVLRPLWIYAAAEGVLAVIGAVFPELLGQLGGRFPGGLPLFGAIVGVLLVPSFLMGVALPALAAALQSYGADRPRHIAWLYGLNTLGGAGAALAVGFGMLPLYGLAVSEKGTVLVGLLAAGIAALSGWQSPSSDAARETEAKPEPHPLGIRTPVVVAALVLSGVSALGYEVLWTRILVLVVGSSTNAFTLMLSLYILGLGLGGLWIGRYIDRLNRSIVAFQHLQLGVAAAALAGAALFGSLPAMALFGFAQLGTSPWSIAIVNVLVAAGIVLPPTIFIGASLPVAARLMERRIPRRGRELGAALALVTAGNVVGVLLSAFGLIPAVGLQRGVILLAGFNLAAAILAWIVRECGNERRGFAVPAAVLGVVIVVPVLPSWDLTVMTSGVFRQAPVYLALLGDPVRLERAFAAYRTLYYREGSEAVVAVFDRPTLSGVPHRVLTVDGKVDASTGADMATQVLSGQLPFLFRPDARNALVVGLASGVTVGALAKHPLERIDVVEIEPAVIEASRAFDEVSGAPLKDRRVKVTVGDGRRYLRSINQRFDVIVSEPSNPWLSMSARLFTREFFALVRERLGDSGVLVQWVPLYGLSTRQFKALLRTLLSVFPNVALFQVAKGDLVAIASPEPLSPNPEVLQELFRPASRTALQRIGVNSPADLVGRWVADAEGLRAVLGTGPLNTDDNGLVEFGSPWYLLRDTIASNLSLVDRTAASTAFMDQVVGAWLARRNGEDLLRAVAARYLADERPALVRKLGESLRSSGRSVTANLLLGDAADAEGQWGEAERIWKRQDGRAFSVRRARLAFKRADLSETVRLFGQAGTAGRSADDDITYALALAGMGRPEDALSALESVPSGANPAAAIMRSFIRSALLADMGEARQAYGERKEFEVRVGTLRRCLETDGCRETMDALLAWGRTGSPGLSAGTWEDFRQTLYVQVTRSVSLYLRGVTELWLGEEAAARRSLRTYLNLLPEPDPLSKAHDLLTSLQSVPGSNLESDQ